MGYDVGSRIFHWGTVLMIFVMIPVGLTMTQEIPRYIQDPLFVLHKGLGVLVLAFVAARIGWRAFHPAPPLPATIPPLQRAAARASHVALYALILTMGVSGYVRVTTGGFPIEALGALGVDPLLARNEAVAAIAKRTHAITAFALIAAILLHVAAASYHGLVRKDGVVARMWPPFSS